MDIIIPNSWLKDYLKTQAKPEKIAGYLSLCGPSVERIQKVGDDTLYSIEVTTNRTDSACVYGIAQEAAAILPRFGLKAELLPVSSKSKQKLTPKVSYLNVKVDFDLCLRFTAILIKNVKVKKSPEIFQERLTRVGSRPINNVVDISNYLMLELGQPVHTFDYDKIQTSKMILRKSKRGEEVVTLDGKKNILPGGDIVIEDGSGKLIDLAGIMGGKNSAVDENTKNVLLFVQTYNPIIIRKTSMAISKRSEAVALFEKGLDPEKVETTIRRGVDLMVELCGGTPEQNILDLYPNPYKVKQIKTNIDFIQARLGVNITKAVIGSILTSLGFKVNWTNKQLSVSVPSWRANDVNIQEDILEEVARLYGYFNLPSNLMTGVIPEKPQDQPFDFEMKIKRTLKGFGGIEVFTYSLVSEDKIDIQGKVPWVLKLKNPLGTDGQYLRLSLGPSLVAAKKQNSANVQFHLFEMSNIYLPTRGELPEEKMMLAGVFSGYSFQEAKGLIEALLEELRINAEFTPNDTRGFLPNQRLSISKDKLTLGQFGVLEQGKTIYYEFDVQSLQNSASKIPSYKGLPKYPGQVEDISLVLPSKTHIGNVIETLYDADVVSVELIDSYESTKTFRIVYQNPNKTLTDKEVCEIREKIIKKVEKKFSARVK